jgi:FkbM family methyltransferase
MQNLLRVKVVLYLLKIYEFFFHPRFDNVYIRLFARVSTDNMVIFDIGAHRGESIRAFIRLFPGAKIHAFEPDAENYNSLYESWGNAKNVYLNNSGMGNEKGEREFYNHLLTTTSTFNKINAKSEWVKFKSRLLNVEPEELVNASYAVRVEKLDDYVEENSLDHICILKLDTEGFELECLEGAKKILNEKKVDVIQIEGNNSDTYKESAPYTSISRFYQGTWLSLLYREAAIS